MYLLCVPSSLFALCGRVPKVQRTAQKADTKLYLLFCVCVLQNLVFQVIFESVSDDKYLDK